MYPDIKMSMKMKIACQHHPDFLLCSNNRQSIHQREIFLYYILMVTYIFCSIVLKCIEYFQELIATPIVTTQMSEHVFEKHNKHVQLEPLPYKPEYEKPRKFKAPPAPSPSKFVKGEFRESDYESDYEGRIPPIWGADGEPSYRPVRPVLTPLQHHQRYRKSPTPPTEFDHPPQIHGPSRPKFEPIEKFISETQKSQQSVVFKPKPVSAANVTDLVVAKQPIILQPGTPPEIGYSPGPKKTQYYKSTVSAPYTNAIQTETSNVVHFDESTENSYRTMSVQQTHKVIKFGDQYKQESKLEPFPFQVEPEQRRRATSVPPPPTPTKFVPGEFRESDYESEVEITKIKPKWSPVGETDIPHYRKVRAPATIRSSSVPAPKERVVTPMEFDTQSSYISTQKDRVDGEMRKHESLYKKFCENKSNQLLTRSHSYEPALHPGTPPEYGYISKSTATKLASEHMDSMTKEFKSKTQKFVTDIMGDVNKKSNQKPILKKNDEEAQVYREESRAAQYGK